MQKQFQNQSKSIQPPTATERALNDMQQIVQGVSLAPQNPPAELMPMLLKEAKEMLSETATELDVQIYAIVLFRVNYGIAYEALTKSRYSQLKKKYEKEDLDFLAETLKK